MQGIVNESSGLKSVTYTKTAMQLISGTDYTLGTIFDWPIDINTVVPLYFELDLIIPSQGLKYANTTCSLKVSGATVATWTGGVASIDRIFSKTLFYPVMRSSGFRGGTVTIGLTNNILIHTGLESGTISRLWSTAVNWSTTQGDAVRNVEAYLKICYLEVSGRS